MKAITLHQPWATIIALGLKQYETRSWPTNYRGALAIHAGRASSEPGLDSVVHRLIVDDWTEETVNARFAIECASFPLGAVVCFAQLVACEQMTPDLIAAQTPVERAVGDWQPGRYAWRLEDIVPIDPPIAARGAQGLWDYEEEA